MSGDVVGNIRVVNPNNESECTFTTVPIDLVQLVACYITVRRNARVDNSDLMYALAKCFATSIALRPFGLLGGFDVAFDTASLKWEPSLKCVYSLQIEKKELSPALSMMVACVAAANGVAPDLDCMHDCRVSIITGERVGRYKPVLFTYTPEDNNKRFDITRAVVLVSPGNIARYRGSYDIETSSFRDLDENELPNVDKSLVSLGGKYD